ncbi:MAG: EF-P beta-lysylation protein EpmB [Methylococcaceae bacterium]|nr:EF-P beta-lysylation protein EpmB [Methylococcaceae bacterium]
MPEHPNEEHHFSQNWQQQLRSAFKSIDELCHYLHLSTDDLSPSVAAARQFPVKVPLSFAASMEKGNPDDPLLKQVLPIHEETVTYPGFSHDPVGDVQAMPTAGLVHKYRGRALFITTGSCAINCRYCFRRNFPYSDLQLSKERENAAMQYIRDDSSLSEIILSGGDPLLLSDDRLKELMRQIEAIAHVRRIRIHSRLPIVLPARITDELLEMLSQSPLKIVLVVHCNHANEINERVSCALKRLRNKGLVVFNQAVLLKGVNDKADVLCQLSETLFAQDVIPYYLHLLDKASGTGHFEVSKQDALALIKEIQAYLPGYLVPRLVKERVGALAKESVFA